MVRVAFIEEEFPDLLNEARTLSQNYTTVEGEIIRRLGLTRVSKPVGLDSYLRDPVDWMTRVLFDPLFDLLKGKIDVEAFEQVASSTIERPFYRDLYRLGYQNWLALSLVELLSPTKIFDVPIAEFNDSIFQEEGTPVAGARAESVPRPRETKCLSLAHYGGMEAFIVPDFIIHSAKINRYVAIRTEPIDAAWMATTASEKREWYSLNSLRKEYSPVVLWPDLIVYVDDEPCELVLIADSQRICRPDLVMECMEQEGWFDKEGMEKMKLRHNTFRPRAGTYIVSRESVPEQAYRELMLEQESRKQESAIRILAVGFDQSKLEPIIGALMHGWSNKVSWTG